MLPALGECCSRDTTGKTLEFLSSAPRKIIISPKDRTYDLAKSPRARYGGRFAIVTTRGAGCDGRGGAGDDARQGGRPSRVVVVPRRWDQAPGQESGATEANKPGTPAGARSKP